MVFLSILLFTSLHAQQGPPMPPPPATHVHDKDAVSKIDGIEHLNTSLTFDLDTARGLEDLELEFGGLAHYAVVGRDFMEVGGIGRSNIRLQLLLIPGDAVVSIQLVRDPKGQLIAYRMHKTGNPDGKGIYLPPDGPGVLPLETRELLEKSIIKR